MSPAAPKPPVAEKKPRKRLQPKTPLAKVNKARLDRRTKAYKAYMSSTDWKRKRIARLSRDNWTCQECGWVDFITESLAGRLLHVDHLTYARFGKERIEDLLTLCGPCHMKKHAMSAIRPRFKRAG